jgi:regulation of enolase protein 1 (concanavalin A-like superfamily)
MFPIRVRDGPMSIIRGTVFALTVASNTLSLCGEEVLFRETFSGKLQDGWSWRREDQAAWRIGTETLEIRIQPGNMWGPANDAKNVLICDLPAARTPLEVSITVSNRPTEQYEQVDLGCYSDDSHMVKIGFELVDGKRSVVMGREANDHTRTIAIIPLTTLVVELRLIVDGAAIRGSFRPAGSTGWHEAGTCDPPARGLPKLSLQCYQGPAQAEHWATISNVVVRALPR